MGPRDGCELHIITIHCYQLNSSTADSLGGDVHWSTGISVISDIPKKAQWPVKTHVFVNAGRLDTIDKCMSPSLFLCAQFY